VSVLRWSVVLCLGVGGLGCQGSPEIVAEEEILSRQRAGLEELIARSRTGPLLPEDELLIVVEEGWVQQVLRLELPRTSVLAGRYRVEVTGVDVNFDDGLGLVRLRGRVSFASRPGDRLYAELGVYGALDVVELDPESGVLRGRVTPIAFEVRRVTFGVDNSLGRELVEALGREKLDSFAALALEVEIPVRLEQRVELPGLGPGGPVEFAGAEIPIAAAVSQVVAVEGRLWISVRASLPRRATEEG